MIDPSLIGRFGPDFEMPIEHGKIREFANATYAPWPVYLDDPHAVIPPTFLTTAGVLWGYTLERPRGTYLEDLDHDLSVPLHAEETYVFHGEPPRAGDTLTARAGLESVVEKQGRRGGDLTFLTLLTEFRNPAGDLVAEARSVTVTTDTHDEVAATAPAYHPTYEGLGFPDPFAGIVPGDPDPLSGGASPGVVESGTLTLRELVRYAVSGGEDNPLHYDLAHAKACGFPGMFGLGMHQAGGLAAYAVRWLGAQRVRSVSIRFLAMYYIGDVLRYEGRALPVEVVDGHRMVDVDLVCRRASDDAAIVKARMRFDLDG